MNWIQETLQEAAKKMAEREDTIQDMRATFQSWVNDEANKQVDAGATPDEAAIIVDDMIEQSEAFSSLARKLCEHYLELWYEDVTGADDMEL